MKNLRREDFLVLRKTKNNLQSFICIYCKKAFRAAKGKVPCPNCGYQKPCSGHRILTKLESDILKKDHPKAFEKDKPKDRPSGGTFKRGST